LVPKPVLFSKRVVLGFLVAGLLAGGASAQAPLAESPLTPLVQSEAELEAFRAIQVAGRAAERQTLIAEFLVSFPSSELRYLVLRTRWLVLMEIRADPESVIRAAEEGMAAARAFLAPRLELAAAGGDAGYLLADFELRNLEAGYYRSMAGAAGELGDPARTAAYTADAIDAAESAWRGFQTLAVPGSDEYVRQFETYQRNRLGLFQNAMVVFRDAGRFGEAAVYGDHALAADPENLFTLLALSSLMARALPEAESDRGRFLGRALNYATRALERIGSAIEPVDGIGAEETARLEGAARATLGLVYYHLGDLEASRGELIRAVDAAPEDADAWYRLGLVYARTEESGAALSALSRAVYLGIADPDVRSSLEAIYQVVHGSLDGLDQFIDEEGRRALAGR
jgi:tetratricopeptide (TPR) repeat protein